jgi:hypothetical protein
MSVLARDVWTSRAEAHRTQVEAWTTPHLERRSRGHKHPVEDFLFDYYAFRPAELRRWHPGFGVTLGDAPEYDGLKGYQVVDGAASVTDTYLCAQLPLVRQIETLLRATADRPAAYGCFGLHEWAMVYRLSQEQVRHAAWPLRLGSAGTDAVVESHTVACSHFDAFRFFTPPARPLNILQPGRDDRPVFEQPGCLHANMDLYKHAARLAPLVAPISSSPASRSPRTSASSTCGPAPTISARWAWSRSGSRPRPARRSTSPRNASSQSVRPRFAQRCSHGSPPWGRKRPAADSGIAQSAGVAREAVVTSGRVSPVA